jgi:hydantoinase/carbamoylase family amidase
MSDQPVSERAGDRPQPAINLDRLRQEMTRLGEIGREPGVPGINRPGFSDADMQSRRHMAEQMRQAGLTVSMDCVGNLSGLWEAGDGARVMVGSHLDSVPMGGMFDGALGVCAALECVRTLREAGAEPAHPIEVIATAEEEGRFGGMLGAQALSGQVDPEWLTSTIDEKGERLVDAMQAQGLKPDRYKDAARDPASVRAFLELHVEQGPVLERSNLQIGIVDVISGVINWTIRLVGETNHSGTTPMNMRRDAFAGLAEFAAEIPALINAVGDEQTRITIGAVELTPGFPHSIPGEATFSLVVRDTSLATMQRLDAECRERLKRIAAAHGLKLDITVQSWLEPKACDSDIVAMLSEQAERLGQRYQVMPSGAGHDTQMMSDLTKAGLIFVPSIGGISHAPEEHTAWPDIEAGTNLLLGAVSVLSGCRLPG